MEQWIKNAFVFCGVLFSGRFMDPASLVRATLTFVAFCLVASAGYIDNDIADREADRLHPLKARRPVAAGQITVGTARLLSALLLVVGIAIAWWMGRRVGTLLLLYAVLSAAYSRRLKHVVVLDVLAIATGFVLRVVAGCAVIEIVPSRWLLLCAFMLAAFLGFGKRRHEALLLGGHETPHRPVLASYSIGFLDQLISVASALTLTCYIMFTMWPETIERHGTTDLVYTVPLVMYGLFRYDFLIHRESGGGDPGHTLFTDRHILAVVVLWALSVALILGAEPTGERWLPS